MKRGLTARHFLQRRKQLLRRGKMFLAGGTNQAKPLPVGRAVRHAEIRRAIRQLLFCRPQRARLPADNLKFPARDFCFRKPAAQFRDDFWRRDQFDEQAAAARGDFLGWTERLQFSPPRRA